MRSIATITAAAVAALLVSATLNWASAEDDIAVRDLSLEQAKIFRAGSAKQTSLQVTASVNRIDRTYAKGEKVKLRIKVNEDAHVLVFNTGPKGKTVRLFPNEKQKSDLVKAGHSISIPPAGTSLKVTGDTGAELITVVASNQPFKLASGVVMSGDDVFVSMKESADEFARDLALETDTPKPARKVSMVKLPIKTVASR
jgi:hypothetical protein